MKDSAALKAAVQRFWDTRPCGAKNTTAEPGTRALPRFIAYWLGRMMGSFWYIKAVK
jgi:hypothetical protein